MNFFKDLFGTRGNDTKTKYEQHLEEENKVIEAYKQKPEPRRFYKVAGAGEISLSEWPSSCGNSAGISIGISWGKYGYAGGVLGYGEAKRMAEFLLEMCAKETRSEEEIIAQRNADLRAMTGE